MTSHHPYLASRVNRSWTNSCETSVGDPVGRGLYEVPPAVTEPFLCLVLQTLPGVLRLFVNGEIGEFFL